MNPITINVEWEMIFPNGELQLSPKMLGYTDEEWRDELSDDEKRIAIKDYLNENRDDILDGYDLEVESFEEE